MKDTYWHLQMHLPEGPGKPEINPKDMLKEPVPVIGTGEWDNKQCRDFKGMPAGSIVMVRVGNKPVALCEVTGPNFQDAELSRKYRHENFRRVRILEWNRTGETSSLFSQGTLSPLYKSSQTRSWEYINTWYRKVINQMEIQMELQKISKLLELKKQIILQGAPGTGKTYSTAALALSILRIPFNPDDHAEIMRLYREQEEKKHICFTTFHQSMDYEDFIEGLKPEIEDGGITYKVEDGIFKKLCFQARHPLSDASENTFEKAVDAFRQRCLEQQDKGEYVILKTKADGLEFQVSYDPEKPNFFRVHPQNSVKEDAWYPINITKLLLTCYKGEKKPKDGYSSSYVTPILDALGLNNHPQIDRNQNYVLIIDEINRGNISKIFGELITLLENDKRSGGAHPLQATLPYSKESFEIPSNLYIIGTMNTTDRSVGFIDYAVRRRFAFYTLPASREAIGSYYAGKPLGATAQALFDQIKQFIFKHKSPDLDIDDLMVGHSYFMAAGREELQLKLEYEIIPLLREYEKDGILLLSEDERKDLGTAWRQLLA